MNIFITTALNIACTSCLLL